MRRADAVNSLIQLLKKTEPRRSRLRGLLGDPSETVVVVSGEPNHVWFREDGNSSKLRKIINLKVPSLINLPVVIGEDANNPGREQVLDIDMAKIPNWLGRAFVPSHHETHELGAVDSVGNRVDSDVVFIQKPQFVPMSARAQSTPDMSLYIEADFYRYGDTRQFWAGGSTKTFSAPVTDGYAAYELICVNGVTNTLTYVRSVDFPIAAPKDYTLVPDAPIGSLPIACAYLPHGETSLDYSNIVDVRLFQGTLGGTVLGSPHRHTSETDGGMLSSGLVITGDITLQRASDDARKGYWYSELGEWSIDGGVTITGDLIVTGGRIEAHDTYSDLGLGLSRLRIPRGTEVSGWAGLEAEIAWDTGAEIFYLHDGEGWEDVSAGIALGAIYLRLDASNDPMTGNLEFLDGVHLAIDTVRARDGDGLELYDDEGNGIFVEDGGKVGFMTSNPQYAVEIAGSGHNLVLTDSGDAYTPRVTLSHVDGFGGFIEIDDDARAPKVVMRGYAVGGVQAYFMAGNVGIGTSNPNGLLHINSVATPTDSQFLIQANSDGGLSGLVYSADNVMIGFDLYWDGSAWKSLDAGSNFEIYKINDKLHIQYDSGVALGAAPTMNPGIVLDTAGKVGIGISTALAKMHVDQATADAAIPVLYLDQADVSEEMVQFETTIGEGNAIEAVGAKTLTVTHYIKVTLPGGLTRYLPVGTIA